MIELTVPSVSTAVADAWKFAGVEFGAVIVNTVLASYPRPGLVIVAETTSPFVTTRSAEAISLSKLPV